MSGNIFHNRYCFSEEFVDEEYDEDSDFDEDFDEDFGENDPEAATLPCPYCGKAIYEDAEVCPECGSYVVMEDGRSARPFWIVGTTILLITLFLFGFVRLF